MADAIEQQIVDKVIGALRTVPGVKGVSEGQPPSELGNKQLPWIWLDVEQVPAPASEGIGVPTNHALYELTFVAQGLYKPGGYDDGKRVGRDFYSQMQFAVMRDVTQGKPRSGDTRENGHDCGPSAWDGVWVAGASWIVKFVRLRNDPYRESN